MDTEQYHELCVKEALMHEQINIMETSLREVFPVGSTVEVILKYGQVNLTKGTVFSHSKSCVRVQLHTPNQSCRDVHFNNVSSCNELITEGNNDAP